MNDSIRIKGANENNLKNITLDIPKNKLIVLTGVSGSGKSSLAFDTLQKECQRQYMESMAMITENVSKPKVESIIGLSPAISVDQRVYNSSPRSTVGTVTEILTYLRVLYAKVGLRPCPKCNTMVEPPFEVDADVLNFWDRDIGTEEDESNVFRDNEIPNTFSVCPNCKTHMPEIRMSNFSFNKPEGACPTCSGIGETTGVNISKLLNEELSILDGGVSIWHAAEIKRFSNTLQNAGRYFGFPFDTSIPIKEYDDFQRNFLLYGIYTPHFKHRFPDVKYPTSVDDGRYDGIVNIIMNRFKERANDLNYRKKIEKLLIQRTCPDCNGTRLREESRRVTIAGKSIIDISKLSLDNLSIWLNSLPSQVPDKWETILNPILSDLRQRIKRLIDVGVGYLTLGRTSFTLSAGEYQRLRLASLLGSGLTGVLYVLDEPTTGLHQRDTGKLIRVLRQLRDLGNTVLVVEHDMELMKAADYIIDIGPGAGKNGGHLVTAGTPKEIESCKESVTVQCLLGYIQAQKNDLPPSKDCISIIGANENNLRNINVNIPLNQFTVISGVSGSGKSTLIFDILDKAANQHYNGANVKPGEHTEIRGWEKINRVITIDQTPIGRTPRSNAATYTDVFTSIRTIYANLEEAKKKKLTLKHFSFNVPGGRCEKCQGAGVLTISMHFLPDEQVCCPVCHGKRFKRDILDIKYKGYHIADILNMTISEAMQIFEDVKPVYDRLSVMSEVGIGYLQLGQAATTLSGGEAQRIKLAKELGKRNSGHTLYLLDEPTSGLHPYDVVKLISLLQNLVKEGNTVVVIEHNMEVIKSANWIIDMGPEGGEQGGLIVAEGTQEQIARIQSSITGKYLFNNSSTM
ncbi:excinuclease ABC subunit A [Anaerocolumna cellulosilytica]|uniref:UvrABC system protein A n=1 Tax=Anaerocolumna cellulosilytica TaxID=433286 RepID=A0A6S6QU63_9FIRM|nr:excinuclease ABC subunit UvrA [Anaerocolumna cellulosilytica]MBB5193943.1 excinuclease ABC subunit A [Anaerocolumna cellulosilytica]BCJ94843.1 excinuclease ABC subunit A [Anaerocolumna cellulosilytica]